ncbi:hypothetical protein Droror1_Dr00017980, partial [Drosera rotundifolia]
MEENQKGDAMWRCGGDSKVVVSVDWECVYGCEDGDWGDLVDEVFFLGGFDFLSVDLDVDLEIWLILRKENAADFLICGWMLILVGLLRWATAGGFSWNAVGLWTMLHVASRH